MTPADGFKDTLKASNPTPVQPEEWFNDADIVRLADLDLTAYDHQRKATAKARGVRLVILDKLVKARRALPGVAAGRSASLPNVKPWPSPVATADLLDALTAAIQRHVILGPADADVAAVWIAHTWVAERFQHTPRLSISSSAKWSGKTTLLEVVRATCRRPLRADNISANALLRAVSVLAPLTVLLNEAENYVGNNEELKHVLSSGFNRSGEVVRFQIVKGVLQTVRFKTFAPVALAGIGALPPILQDKAVPIVLQPRDTAGVATRLHAPGARVKLAELASKAARWADDRGPALTPNPSIPTRMTDRERDLAVPLLAVADDGGPAWGRRIRVALLGIFGMGDHP